MPGSFVIHLREWRGLAGQIFPMARVADWPDSYFQWRTIFTGNFGPPDQNFHGKNGPPGPIIIHIIMSVLSILFTQNTNDTTILGKWRKVAYIEVIGDVHATCKGHIRTKKTLAEVGKVYKCQCAKICHRQICVIVPCVSMTQM